MDCSLARFGGLGLAKKRLDRSEPYYSWAMNPAKYLQIVGVGFPTSCSKEWISVVSELSPKPSKMSTKKPSEFLKSIIGRPVIIKLNSGVEFHGILACLDGFVCLCLVDVDDVL